jgi:hydroxylaminobenzene mutase
MLESREFSEMPMDLENRRRVLMFHGVLIFLLGLVTGLFVDIGAFTNNRQGLAAHLEGIMNGTFVIALGLLWSHVNLPPRADRAARWLPVAGAYMNWVLAAFAATFGRGRTSHITPADRLWFPFEMPLTETALVVLAVFFIVSCGLVLWGLRRPLSSPRDAAAI